MLFARIRLKGVTLRTGIVQSKILWKSMATFNHFVIKISSFVLNRTKKFIQAWNKID